MDQRHVPSFLLVDCVASISVISTWGGCVRPRVTVGDNFDKSAHPRTCSLARLRCFDAIPAVQMCPARERADISCPRRT